MEEATQLVGEHEQLKYSDLIELSLKQVMYLQRNLQR